MYCFRFRALTPDQDAIIFTVFVEGYIDIITMYILVFLCVGIEIKIFEKLTLFAYLVPPLKPQER